MASPSLLEVEATGSPRCENYATTNPATLECQNCGGSSQSHVVNQQTLPPSPTAALPGVISTPTSASSTPSSSNNGTTTYLSTPASSRKGKKVRTTQPTGSKVVEDKRELPLPVFSAGLLAVLNGNGCLSRHWRMLINEAANHYISFPIGHASQYDRIGQSMAAQYPKIALDGDRQWGVFTKRLSQKIRTMRMEKIRREKEEQLLASRDQTTLKIICQSRPARDLFVDYEPDLNLACGYKGQLMNELAKPRYNEITIFNGLKMTYGLRTKFLAGRADRKSLFSAYTCLRDSKYLLKELEFMIGSEEQMTILRGNVTIMLNRLKQLEDEETIAKALLKFQQKYATKKGPFFLKIFEDSETYETAISREKENLPTIITLQEEGSELEFVIACFDGVVHRISDWPSAILSFFAIHLAFELPYASSYRHALHCLESFCFGYDPVGLAQRQKSYLTKLKLQT